MANEQTQEDTREADSRTFSTNEQTLEDTREARARTDRSGLDAGSQPPVRDMVVHNMPRAELPRASKSFAATVCINGVLYRANVNGVLAHEIDTQ